MRGRVTGRSLLASLAVLALVAAGCGDDDSSADSTTTTDAPSDETTATTEPKDEGFVSSLQIRAGDGADQVIIRDDPIEEADPEDVPEDTDDLDNFDSYTEYELVTDSTGSLQMEIPVEWEFYDLAGGFIDENGVTTGVGLGGSPDQAGFDTTWSVPGVRFSAQPITEFTGQEFLDASGWPNECTDGGTSDYDDGLYTGLAQVWEDCGGIGTTYVVIWATDADFTVDILVAMQVVTEADLEAAEQIVNTFQVVGPV